MPDLALSSVYSFWYEYDSKILYRIVCSIEAVETWIPDSADLQGKISDLGDLLDNKLNLDLVSPETMVTLLTSIKFSQALKLNQVLKSTILK